MAIPCKPKLPLSTHRERRRPRGRGPGRDGRPQTWTCDARRTGIYDSCTSRPYRVVIPQSICVAPRDRAPDCRYLRSLSTNPRARRPESRTLTREREQGSRCQNVKVPGAPENATANMPSEQSPRSSQSPRRTSRVRAHSRALVDVSDVSSSGAGLKSYLS